MTSIVDYASLQSAVGDWLHRQDLSAKIPDFIGNAEALMSARLKSRSMETRATITCTPGNAYVALPLDVIESRRLAVTSTTPQRVLKYVTPDEIIRKFPYTDSSEPMVWTVIGPNVQLAPVPDSAYPLELTYLQKIPSLSNTTTTNWLLTGYPNVYLYGALSQAAIYIRDADAVRMFAELFNAGMDAINAIDWFSGSTMNVRAA